ncbi:MAG TPA: hypothetical protein DEO59_16610 [Balneola sp.]|jgi:hypothetical protein|nr:hypothetical protein [Balneola sp.]MAO78551.1 hypothetical protein [Balneola sp.]MBF64916.1 hypothetical protein [Balneola sp.]HBZ40009.1 hypothetical protein [Balneola sp.]|tara:strand:- start:7759 stop:8742 length:984 start_codon:yes stop_codon:yes gene_type:complete
MTKNNSLILLLFATALLSCEFLGLTDSSIPTQGEYLYYVSQGEKNPGDQIFRYSLEHENHQELTSFNGAYNLIFDINPDGNNLVIQTSGYGASEGKLYLFNIAEGKTKKLEAKATLNPFNLTDTTFVHAEGRFPIWSPNGRYIAYNHVSLPVLGIYDNYIYDVKKKTISAVEFNQDDEFGVYWASDSERIFFRRVKTNATGLYVSGLKGENQAKVFDKYMLINTGYSEELVFGNTESEIHLINKNTIEVERKYVLNIPDLDSFNIIEFIDKKNRLLLDVNRFIDDKRIHGIYLYNLNTGKHELVLEASDKIKLGSYSKYYNPYLTSN